MSTPIPLFNDVDNNKTLRNYSVKLYTKDVLLKRCFIPIAGILGFVICLPNMHSYIYLPVFVFFIGFILYWNFPILILFTNLRPLYYEDLFIDTSKIPLIDIDPNVKSRFETVFEWSLIFSNSLFSAAISEYWLYQAYSKESYIEIVGITGGILKIFQIINHINGNVILHITKRWIDKELNKQEVSINQENSQAKIQI